MQQTDAVAQALEQANPSRDDQRKSEFDAMMRYRHGLGSWYAGMFSAARRGVEFTRPQPEPPQFQARRQAYA